MKRIYLILCAMALLITACNEEFNNDATIISKAEIGPHSSSADVVIYWGNENGSRSNALVEEMGVFLSTNPNPTDKDERRSFAITSDNYSTFKYVYQELGCYAFTIDGLSVNTTYYALPFISNRWGKVTGDIVSFTTTGTASVTTKAATQITTSTAQVNGNVKVLGNSVNLEKRGFVISLYNNPTIGDANTHNWAEVGKEGDYSVNFTGFSSNTKYYFRAYAIAEGETIYGSTLSFTTEKEKENVPFYTVSQIMDIYNSLNLSAESTSSDTYTVRGYVTQWISGYPDYQNADFWIDDSSTGSTSRLKCFRLTGVLDSDKRTLKVGDYIEAQNCHLMNYNGTAELKDGTFTVIKAASANVPSLSDFLGTYLCQAHREANDGSAYWDNVVISSFVDTEDPEFNIIVEGLYYGESAFAALGTFDETKGYIRLWGAWYLTEKTCTVTALGDVLVNPVFYPCYIDNSHNVYLLENNSSSNNFAGEIILKMNSSGILSFTASDKIDNNNRYANAYRFLFTYASNSTATGYGSESFLLDGTTLTKTSSASAPSRIRLRTIKAQH